MPRRSGSTGNLLLLPPSCESTRLALLTLRLDPAPAPHHHSGLQSPPTSPAMSCGSPVASDDSQQMNTNNNNKAKYLIVTWDSSSNFPLYFQDLILYVTFTLLLILSLLLEKVNFNLTTSYEPFNHLFKCLNLIY